MADFAAARRMMVDGQVRTSDVTDLRLLDAMLAVPREQFVPAPKAALAYLDCDVPLQDGVEERCARRLLKPMVLAKLIQAAAPAEGDRVLDLGCATGYAGALLSRLAGAIVALDDDEGLAREARQNLAAAGCGNVEVVRGSLAAGWPAGAPYDVILIEGAVETIPAALNGQLRAGGRLVCVRGAGPASKAMLYRMDGGEVSGRPIFDASAPLLPGFAQAPGFVF